MIRRSVLPILTLAFALAGLIAPGAALADVPTGSWQITGLVLDGKAIEAKGTIGFGDSRLSASVGCNSIGGPASVKDAVLITGDLTTTLVGCPAAIGAAENALMKMLSGGPMTMAADRWANGIGEIDVALVDGGAPGCIPPFAPGANPGNVTVPCGNGNAGSGANGGNGSTVDPTGPSSTAASDPLPLEIALGGGLLLIATIGVYIYLGPQRKAEGGAE
jgi:heat shock protein HslJ